MYLYYIGKARDRHSNAIADEFIKRSCRYADCQMREVDPRRFDPIAKHATARRIALDPAGAAHSSADFIEIVRDCENLGLDLVLLVGGHDGLPGEWRNKAELLSLSPMTFPHELARAMLAEQVYRAYTTLHGHPYPR